MLRAKQKAPREVSGEVPTQLRLSRKDKGKIPLSLPNLEALAPSANPTPMGEILSREAGTVALCSAKYLHSKVKRKASQRASREVTDGVASASI